MEGVSTTPPAPPPPPPSSYPRDDFASPSLGWMNDSLALNGSGGGGRRGPRHQHRRGAAAVVHSSMHHEDSEVSMMITSSNSKKRPMGPPSVDSELEAALGSMNLSHLHVDLRRVAERMHRVEAGCNDGSLGSVASTASTDTASLCDDHEGSSGILGPPARKRRRTRNECTHHAYGSHDFQGILQSLFQPGGGIDDDYKDIRTSL